MKFAQIGLATVLCVGAATWVLAQDAPPSASGKVVARDQAMVVPAALWTEEGTPMVARGAEAVAAAPANAVRVTVRVFGATGVREVTVPAGSEFLPPKGAQDTVVYLAKGRMTVTLGDEVTQISAGDVFQKAGSSDNKYQAHEDSVLVEHYVPSP